MANKNNIPMKKVQKVAVKTKGEFKDILTFSERNLRQVWGNKKDNIWKSYLKK